MSIFSPAAMSALLCGYLSRRRGSARGKPDFRAGLAPLAILSGPNGERHAIVVFGAAGRPAIGSALLAEQLGEANLRPGFKPLQVGEQIAERQEAAIQQINLARHYCGAVQIEQVHDSQMYAADLALVVVDQSYALLRVPGVDRHLFLQLAAETFPVRAGISEPGPSERQRSGARP